MAMHANKNRGTRKKVLKNRRKRTKQRHEKANKVRSGWGEWELGRGVSMQARTCANSL
jgi:hypothetical protein